MIGELDRVERRSARFRRRGRVRARAVEPELDRDPRLARPFAGRVLAPRVPVQYSVAVVEQMGSHHERLGAPPFLGRAAVKPQRPLERAGLDLFAERQRRHGRGHAEQMVAAAVSRRHAGTGLAIRHEPAAKGRARRRTRRGSRSPACPSQSWR